MISKLSKIIVLALSLSLLVLIGCTSEKEQKESPQQGQQTTGSLSESEQFIGSQAPDFTLQSLSGEKVILDQFDGKVVLLNFWGTWCPSCKKEIPTLTDMYSEHQDRGLEIVGVTLQSGPPEKIKSFVRKNFINYHVLTGERENVAQVAQKYDNISSIPTTYVIDRNGIVQHKWVGPRSKREFMRVINKYL